MARNVLVWLSLATTLSGCMLLDQLDNGDKAVSEAEDLLRTGDLPAAAAAYDAALAADSGSIDAATGAAYSAMMAGDTNGADAILAAIEGQAGDRIGEVQLRRALVALRAGDLDSVRDHAANSGLPAAQLLEAEVLLADGEREQAASLLTELRSTPGSIGDVAEDYLGLIENSDPLVAGLSEAQALWALGQRKVAVRSVEELVKAIPEDSEDRSSQLLLWSGRAATVRETEVARRLWDAILFPPKDQAWRKMATRGIISCAEGDGDSCLKTFREMEGRGAPEAGLADARATAAVLIAEVDPGVAKALIRPYATNGAARALMELGDDSGAFQVVQDGVLAQYLKTGG